MTFLVESPTELTTAATDLLLGLVALFGLVTIRRSKGTPFQRRLWMALFAALAGSSFLGAAAHAIRMPRQINDLLWHPLYFLLGLTLVLLALVALACRLGDDAAKRGMKWLLPLPFAVVLITWLGSGAFIWFVLFEALVMLFALAVYFRLFLRHFPGSGSILAGILISIVAAIAQAAGPYTFRLLWPFDHNGLFHLIQLPGVCCFILGARSSLAGK